MWQKYVNLNIDVKTCLMPNALSYKGTRSMNLNFVLIISMVTDRYTIQAN